MNNYKINKDEFEILKKISKDSNISQRKLSTILGFSLGKLNYLIKELEEKGLIKIKNLKKNNEKSQYLYFLTATGVSSQAEFAFQFVSENIEEYEKVLIKKHKILNQVAKKGIGHNSSSYNEVIEENVKRTKPLFKTIAINIKRRTIIVDDVLSTHNGYPIPSWIELSIIDVCNRSCSFCPKSDPKIAPDTHQRMQMGLIDKLTEELKEIKYKGSVTLCGYGEPMLHKDINLICKKLSEAAFVEVVTNGDPLNPKKINELYVNNVNKLLISMYDGKHQILKFKKMIHDSGVPEDFVILRDRWYDAKKDYGLKLTNRTGTIDIGKQEKIGKYKKCFYPSYQFLVDWNGDIFLCPQDWQRRMAMGNMMQENIFDIWTGKIMTKYRKNLLNGKRTDNPCTSCNAEGTILGKNHAKKWKEVYNLIN
jgi:EPS-associated MarR family transcriptional regulator